MTDSYPTPEEQEQVNKTRDIALAVDGPFEGVIIRSMNPWVAFPIPGKEDVTYYKHKTGTRHAPLVYYSTSQYFKEATNSFCWFIRRRLWPRDVVVIGD